MVLGDAKSIDELRFEINQSLDEIVIYSGTELRNVKVINLEGKEVLSQRLNSNRSTLSTALIRKGFYLFHIELVNGKKVVERIVVN